MSRHFFLQAPPAHAGSGAAGGTLDEESVEACCRRLERTFREEPYYSTGRNWEDYAPAYRYALRAHDARDPRHFEDIEPELATEWELVRDRSRLTWPEARPAMAAAWRHARTCRMSPSCRRRQRPPRRSDEHP